MNRQIAQRLKQVGAVLLTVLMVGSMVGGYAFTGAAAATAHQSNTDQTGTTSLESLSSSTEPQTSDETQSKISGSESVQPQLSDYSVNVSTTLQDIEVTNFGETRTGTGRYNISGALEATPSKPIAPVGHPVSIELFIYDESDNMVAHDESNINLKPGSAHPHKLNVNGGVVNLDKNDENTTNPKRMYINQTDYDSDGSVERVVVNHNNNAVVTETGDYITPDDSQSTVHAVRDPYTSEFGFNAEFGSNEDYTYELYITATDGPSDYASGSDPTDSSVDPTLDGGISISNSASSTSISSFYDIRQSTEYREESDVTYVNSYKSTRLEDEKEIYEELGLPIRGAYRTTSPSPAGNVRSFADATNTNGEHSQIVPNGNDNFRISTSVKSVPSNEPQTLVIRYVAPGSGTVRAIPIDSSGTPINNGRDSSADFSELGYELPEDPTTKSYTTGANNRTNIAVIQLSRQEQEQLNDFGEFFLSYENGGTSSDEFRLYCQGIVTGTIDRNTTACGLGLNSAPINDFNNGIITDMSVYPSNDGIFEGTVNDDNTLITDLYPAPSDDRDHVYFEVDVKNAGTEPITNEPVDFFENQSVSFDRSASATQGAITSFPFSSSYILSQNGDGFQGEDVTLTTNLDTGDGTVNVTVSNSAGDEEKFVYDGHRGEITERLDGMSRATNWNIEVEKNLRTGQIEPEVNGFALNAREVGDASNLTQTVSLNPGEETTIRFPQTGDIDPTDYTTNNLQLNYNAHFFDDNASVAIQTDVGGDGDDGGGGGGGPDADAVINGPNTVYRQVSGSSTYQSGTQTVNALSCPDGSGSGDSCGSNSEWELVESDVASSSGTQTLSTQEQSIPLNQSLLSTSVYTGNTNPLTEWGSGDSDVQDPYRNLPGDSSEWTLQSYGISGISDTQTLITTKTELMERYGYEDEEELYRAGWTVEEANVGESIVDYEYNYFRAVSSTSAESYDGETVIDRDSDEWSRLTYTEYQQGDYEQDFTATETTSVETILSNENPNEDTFNDQDWVQGDAVQHIVERSYDESEGGGYDETYAYESPGGDWELNDSDDTPTQDGFRYTRPYIVEDYWIYEWYRVEESAYRLHEKAVTEQENEWTRNFYNTEIEWQRSLSGSLNEYEGPQYAEETEYGAAQAAFTASSSSPAYTYGDIEEYEWTVNGEPVNQPEASYSFTTSTSIVSGDPSSAYTESQEYIMSDVTNTDEITYQPNELRLVADVEDTSSGTILFQVELENGLTPSYQVDAEDVPDDGELVLNLNTDIGVPSSSDSYNVSVTGTSQAGESIPTVTNLEFIGNAQRGGSTLSLSSESTGTVEIGLTVEDSHGFSDSTTKNVDIRECGNVECPNAIAPSLIVSEHSHITDYRTGLANVEMQLIGLGYEQDDYYVAELSPGDISVGSSRTVNCNPDQTEMTASEINNQYSSWSGVSEDSVTSANNPFCVEVNENEDGTTDVSVTNSYGGSDNIDRVVWEGASTNGITETVNFNIDPRANDIITRGSNQFTLELRQLGSENPAQTWTFNVFFCDALNNNDDNRNKLPINRETRSEGGNLCPSLNSDFDSFSTDVEWSDESETVSIAEGDAATDDLDACPYDPGRQEFDVIIDDGDDVTRNCNSEIAPGELGVEWNSLGGNNQIEYASKHVSYKDRYEDIAGSSRGGTNVLASGFDVKLGYNPDNQSQLSQDHLLAYYPMNEREIEYNNYNFVNLPVNASYDVSDHHCQNNAQITCPDDLDVTRYSIYNVSDGAGNLQEGQHANPAWELQDMNKGDLSTYPYGNLWIAVDISGNNNHAPIFHSEKTEVARDGYIESTGPRSSRRVPTEYNDYFRGDESRTIDRGEPGPYGTMSYRFSGYSYMVPFKLTGSDTRFNNNYDQARYDGSNPESYESCANGDGSDCFYPRYKDRDTPLNGKEFNTDMGNALTSSNEFTVSMFVKAGPNVGAGTNRNAWLQDMNTRTFFTFYDWNGKPSGVTSGTMETTRDFALHAQEDAGYGVNSIAIEHNQQVNYPRANHGSHAWPDLPDILEAVNVRPLQPTFGEGTSMSDAMAAENMLATGQGYKSQNVPPEMKSLTVNHYNQVTGNNKGMGVGWKHIVITGTSGHEVSYYVDGFEYKFDLTQRVHDWGDSTTTNRDVASYPVDDNFDGFSGNSLMHIVGGGMNGDSPSNFLNDYYISDYRIYDTAMTQTEVRNELRLDRGEFQTYQKDITNNLQNLNIQTSGESTDESDVVEEMLNQQDPNEMDVGFGGDLNGGEVTVTAYPIDEDGNRINNGNNYVQRTWNQTQNVENMNYFDGPDFPIGNVLEYTNNQGAPDCSGEATCHPDGTTGTPALTEDDALPDFVAKDILAGLDNGSINVDTAYELMQHYDDNHYYIMTYRDYFQNPAYYSTDSSDGYSLESPGIGISSQSQFEEEVGYNKAIEQTSYNTLDDADGIEDEWDIVVDIESRRGAQESPVIDSVGVYTYYPADLPSECDDAGYSCQTE